MNDNARAWVAALRSGKYKQGTGQLRSAHTNRYCCLGVACDISGLATWDGSHYLGEGGILPQPVADWLGLEDAYSIFDEGQLTTLNDDGEPFAAIADLIESEPAGLFK